MKRKAKAALENIRSCFFVSITVYGLKTTVYGHTISIRFRIWYVNCEKNLNILRVFKNSIFKVEGVISFV